MWRKVLLIVALSTASLPAGVHARVWRGADPRRPSADDELIRRHVRARLAADVEALQRFRPGYSFWSNVFTIPDGSVAFGSALDGRLLVTFPLQGDWRSSGRWENPSLRGSLEGRSLPSRLTDRRDEVARLLEVMVGPVVHNPTRGDLLLPNATTYGGFLEEWGRIYERFGVPAELGLAQAIVESGLSGTVKSEARAIGFCQWLPRNWSRLQRLSEAGIEVQNQTTQAAFCAAYLSVLATKYGSFVPALSEHHAGATNVGRTVFNGERLGADDVRERYLLGSELARDLRQLSPRTFRDLLGTYGPRSVLYSEMVFGNMATVTSIRDATPQEEIFAMRVPRDVPLAEVSRQSGLSVEEVRRFNPALIRKVPRGATLYLPMRIDDLGADVSFWHRAAPTSFASVLNEFVHLDVPPEHWEDPGFEPVLMAFRRRFRETDTEEGRVMDAVLGYVMEEIPLSRRILMEFRTDPTVERLFEEGLELRKTLAN
jgi:hypothetical protein